MNLRWVYDTSKMRGRSTTASMFATCISYNKAVYIQFSNLTDICLELLVDLSSAYSQSILFCEHIIGCKATLDSSTCRWYSTHIFQPKPSICFAVHSFNLKIISHAGTTPSSPPRHQVSCPRASERDRPRWQSSCCQCPLPSWEQ